MRRGVTEPVGPAAVRSCGDRAAEDALTSGRRSVLSADRFVRRGRHTTSQPDIGVLLNGRHPRNRHHGDAGLRQRRNGGLQAPSSRRHIGRHRARRQGGRRSEPAVQHKLLPPGIELPAADPMLARHHRRRRARFHALGYDLALLLSRPATAALAAGRHLRATAASARMISRRSVPNVRNPIRHPVVLRRRRHLARNAPRSAMWCRGFALMSVVKG
jgi:hypothetical protein